MKSPLFDLRGKVAIVTGSSRGLGLRQRPGHGAARCQGRHFRDGRRRRVRRGRRRSRRSRGRGEAIAVPCNIGRREEVQHLVGAAQEKWGRVDIVMANAAIHPWVGSVLDLRMRLSTSSCR